MIKIPAQISKYLPKKDKIIGLDIGYSSIKLAQGLHIDSKFSLTRLKIEELDLKQGSQQALITALKGLFQDIDAKGAKINAVINCAQSSTRILTIPFMPKSEITQALKWEMKNFISFPVEKAVIDYQVLQEVVQSGVKKLKLLVACSPQDTVNHYLELFNQAGIKPALFIQPGFALKNIISNLGAAENQPVAVLDIGCKLTELFIFQGKELVFSRKLPVAGANFTKDMSQLLISDLGKTQLSPEQAEGIKKKYGIPATGASEVLEGKLTSSQLISLLRPNLEKLAVEIERSFDFYREKEQGEKIERLILLGGGSQLKGLPDNLAQELDIKVQWGNPLKGILFEDSRLLKENSGYAHRYAQAIGAAFAPDDAVNLLPAELKDETIFLVERSSLKALLTAAITISILGYIGTQIQLGVYNKRLAVSRLELKALGPQMEEMRKQVTLIKADNLCTYYSGAFKEISGRIPEQIRLTKMDARGGTITLKGEIASTDLAGEKVLTGFMNSLESGICKRVTLVTTKKGLSAGAPYAFELKLSVGELIPK